MALGIARFIIMAAFAMGTRTAFAEIRVEPPFWWVGMHDPKVQLMIHGEGIAELQPVSASGDVEVLKIHRTDNPNYLFVDLALSPDTRPGPVPLALRSEEGDMAVPFELRARPKDSADRQGFSPSDVIYLITPDRFANGNPDNDSLEGYADKLSRDDPYGRHGGDLKGLIDHLDYIADMGFTQIWLNPVVENAQPEQSYHGYAATDFYKIDPRYGDNELYRELGAIARERGVGLIHDIVLNHIGSEHWWMKDLPASDWVNYDARFHPTNHRRESLHDPHRAEGDMVQFRDGWFVPTMPDLNQNNPLLAKYLIQNTIWWIEFAGLSGLRVDTYPYSGKPFLAEWSAAIMAEYPNLNIVGEEWSLEPAIVAYWQKGSPRHDDYISAAPSMMDFPLQDALVRGLTEEASWNAGLSRIYASLASDFLYGDPANLVIFPDNHDMSRIYTQLDEDEALWRMAMTFFLTTRGIPQVFYGTEILMGNPGTDSHGVIRSDFPGGWPGDKVNAFTGDGLDAQALAAQGWLRHLLHWRKSASAIHAGDLTHFVPTDDVYVYFRYHDAQTIMVVMHTGGANQDLDLDRFAAMTRGFSSARDVMSDIQFNLNAPLPVAARSVTVLELMP